METQTDAIVAEAEVIQQETSTKEISTQTEEDLLLNISST